MIHLSFQLQQLNHILLSILQVIQRSVPSHAAGFLFQRLGATSDKIIDR
jgi:hypothetical protein